MDDKEQRRFSPFMVQCFVTGAISGNIISQTAAMAYPAVLFPQLRQPESPISLSIAQESWIASVMALPTLIGNFVTPYIMDRMGRKVTLYALTIPIILGWLCIAIATNFEMLLIGRILQGLSYGMLMPVRSVVIGEYTSPINRGAFLATISLSVNFSVLFVHLVGSLFSWQLTALICSFFSYFSLVMTIYCPESPSYLVMKRKYEKCKKAFYSLRGRNEDDELEKMIKARIASDEIQKELDFKEVMNIIKKKEFYKPVIIVIHAFVLLKSCGGPLFGSYAHEIIAALLGSTANVSFWMVVTDVFALLFSIIGIYIVRQYKRKILLLVTGIMCILSLLAISLYLFLKSRNMLSFETTWIPVSLILFHLLTVSIGMLPLPSIISGEVFPIANRATAAGICVVFDCITFFTVLKTFPFLQTTVGIDGAYLLYAAMVTYLLSVMLIMLPETKGRTLQEIEEEFRGESKILKEIEVFQSLETKQH